MVRFLLFRFSQNGLLEHEISYKPGSSQILKISES